MRAYMKSAMPFYGVQKPARAELARAVFAAYPLESAEAWRDTVLALWHDASYREERYLALALLRDRRYRAYRTLDALPLYEELIVSGAWWDFVDEVAGPLGELLPEVAPTLRAWSTDAVMWKRRASIIAQVRRKHDTDFALLADCIEPNRDDREFFIRKAIGWALRSYAWVEPDVVARYCETHELSPLSRREALKHVLP
jgi:3-methyladenine DNA glycosylase AlkD